MKICKMSRKGRFLLTQILLSTSFFISLDSSIIFFGDTGTSSASSEKTLKSDESLSYKDSNEEASSLETTIKEEFSTEAIWLGFEKEVTIATRHETPIRKAPSIVTVITAEEIKNLGYRTFAEILRIIPEVIRGPGSAMYGEDASTAVINIITKGTKDIDGMRVSSGYGSFDTYEENAVFGKRCGEVEISGMVHYRQTNGFDGIVE